MPPIELAGRLLVATPLVGDGIFDRTVISVLAHSDEGTLGVILNRPTATPAAEVLVGWGARAAAPGVVFDGGPVGTDGMIGLARGGAVDLHLDPDDLPDAPAEIRLFVGQAGWGPGQLEGEVAERAWWVVEPEPIDLVTRRPDTLWEDVLRRQGGVTAWYANYPDDLRAG